jgi:hypothetical protein
VYVLRLAKSETPDTNLEQAGMQQHKVGTASSSADRSTNDKIQAAAAAVAAAARSSHNRPKQPSLPAAVPNQIPKIVIKQGGHPVSARSIPLTPQQEQTTTELRKGLWASVERWLVARAVIAPDSQDQAKFKGEVKRLCQMMVFDEYKQTQHHEPPCFDEQLGEERDGGSMRREVTWTKFGFRVAANHPRPPPPLIFTATSHFFSAKSVFGKTQKGLKDLRWKTEFDLDNFFSISFNTQTFEMDEDVDLTVFDFLKTTLNTELTLSELGVLLMIAGVSCRGVSAWADVQDVSFWSRNFTLPELRNAHV